MERSKAKWPRRVVTYAFLALLSLFVLLPLAWVLSTSIKPSAEVFTIPPRWIPSKISFEHYAKVWADSSIPRYFVNSVLVGALSTALSLLLGGAAGYGFARYKFRGSQPLSLFMLFSQMLPLTVLMIPIYFVLLRIGLLDSIVGLAVAHLILTLPVVTWMCRSYFLAIPKDLEEAAQMDGCSHMKALLVVILPLAAPGIAATGIYSFIMSYNEFVLASILTTSDSARTVPIGLTEFSTMFTVDWGGTMAAATLVSLPPILFFLWLQRYFVQGLGQGAVKG